MNVRITYYLKNFQKPIVFQSSDNRSLEEIENALVSSLRTMGISCILDKTKMLIIKNDDVSSILVELLQEKTKKSKANDKNKDTKQNLELESKITTDHTTIVTALSPVKEKVVIPEINLDLPELETGEAIIMDSEENGTKYANISNYMSTNTDSNN